MIGLFFGGGWFQTTFGNQFGNIELDALVEESHEWKADATSNPVEEGAPVTDHVMEMSDKLTIKGFVTDAPIISSFSLEGMINGTPDNNRTQPVFDLLHKLIKAREPVTVYTKYRIYDNMILTGVLIPRAAGGGEAIEFTADFVHLRTVSTQLVDVPPGISAKKSSKSDAATGRKAESKKDGGKKQTEKVEKPSSTLSRVFK